MTRAWWRLYVVGPMAYLPAAGALAALVMGMDAQRLPWREMAERLQALTGVRVHPDTIRNWTRAYRKEVTAQ